jgi:DNA-binding HxlR family transcriptional regulator
MSPSRQHTYACPVQLTIDIVGGKWKPLILWLLKGGRPRRFNDLQRAMPDVAHKVLIQQLRQLERDGLISRTVVSEPHLQVEYCLTRSVPASVPSSTSWQPGRSGITVVLVQRLARSNNRRGAKLAASLKVGLPSGSSPNLPAFRHHL